VTAIARTCIVADDHPSVLRSLTELIRDWGWTVVASAQDGAEALSAIERLRPAVALVDVRMPGASGLEIARQAARSAPETAVAIYTGHGDRALITEALDAGARGVIRKDAPLDELRRALEAVAAGNLYVDPIAGGQLYGSRDEPLLTKREREVLRLLAAGRSYEQVGAELFISAETVRAHVANATRRLGARTRTEAVAIAVRRGLIS
jgi:DNA-binding NarL/FixJ family response regulator